MVKYRTSAPQQQEDVDYGDTIFVLRFAGFQRTKEGEIVTKSQASRFSETEVEKIYWKVEIVWPEQFRGFNPGFSTPLRGIEVLKSDPKLKYPDMVDFRVAGKWTPYLLQQAAGFGFQLSKLNAEDPLFDPAYVEREMANLTDPVSVLQVLERVVEPKLFEADRWVRARCNPGTQWVDTRSVEPLTREEQESLQARIKAARVSAEGRTDLETQIKLAAKSGAITIEQVTMLAIDKGWELDNSKGLLAQLSVEQLRVVVAELLVEGGKEQEEGMPW